MAAARRSRARGRRDRPSARAAGRRSSCASITDQLERLEPGATLETDAGALVVRVVAPAQGPLRRRPSRASTPSRRPSRCAARCCGPSRSTDGALWVDELIGARSSHRRRHGRSASSPASRRTRRATCWSSTPGRSSPRRFVVGDHRRRRGHRRGARGARLMRIDVFTIFPELIDGYADGSILGRARVARARSTCACATCATTRATRAAPSTTRRSAAARAWCSRPGRSSTPSRPSRRPTARAGRCSPSRPAGRRLDQRVAARARRARRLLAAVRALRGHRPARARPPAATAS